MRYWVGNLSSSPVQTGRHGQLRTLKHHQFSVPKDCSWFQPNSNQRLIPFHPQGIYLFTYQPRRGSQLYHPGLWCLVCCNTSPQSTMLQIYHRYLRWFVPSTLHHHFWCKQELSPFLMLYYCPCWLSPRQFTSSPVITILTDTPAVRYHLVSRHHHHFLMMSLHRCPCCWAYITAGYT